MRIGTKTNPVNLNKIATVTGRETMPKDMNYE